MENCRSKCSVYLFIYFFALLIGTAVALLYAFLIIPLLFVAIVGVIAIAGLVLLTVLNSKLMGDCDEQCRSYFPICVLRHLTVTAALTVLFGLLTLVFGGFLIAAAIFLGITVAAFFATVVSVVIAVFSGYGRRDI